MAVSKRDYRAEHGNGKGSKTVWSFAFSYRHRRYRQSGFLSKSEAEAAEARRRHEIITKGDVVVAKRFGCVEDIVEEYTRHRYSKRAQSTVENEIPILKRLTKYFGRTRLDHITDGSIDDYILNRQENNQSNRTINIELSVIRCLLEFARRQGFTQFNVGRLIKNLEEFPKEITIPTDEEFTRFLVECRRVRYGFQFSVYIHLRFATGLRPGESLGLLWTDIDFTTDLIRVASRVTNPLKKGSARFVDIHPSLKRELEAWRKEWIRKFGNNPPHNWVFFNPQKVTEQAKGFRGAFNTARKKAGIPWLRSYDLRHYFISIAVMAGIDYLTIMKWTGHKSSEMIDRIYGHLRPGHSKAQMQKLDFGVGSVVETAASETGVESEKVAV